MSSIDSVTHQSLSLPGYWRVHWVGYVIDNPDTDASDIRFRVFLQELNPANGKPKGDFKICLMPVGEVPRIAIDDILFYGKPVATLGNIKNLKTTTEVLDFSDNNVTYYQRNKPDQPDYPIFPENPAYSLFDDGFYICIRSGSDPYHTIIPAYELFRFFYATSSKLAIAALRDEFLDPDQYLWDTKASIIKEDGSISLWLRKGALDADVKFLALYAFNPKALERAQTIYQRSLTSHYHNHAKILHATPLVRKKTYLQFSYHTDPKTSRRIISRIYQCDMALPMNKITWNRDNDSRQVNDHFEDLKHKGSIFITTEKKSKGPYSLEVGAANNISSPTVISDEDINNRFPKFEQTPATKMEKIRKPNETAKEYKNRVFHEVIGSSVLSYTTSESVIAKAIIQARNQRPVLEPTFNTDAAPPNPSDDFIGTIKHLKNIIKFDLASSKFISAAGNIMMLENWGEPLNIYPKSTQNPWAYSNKSKTQSRLLLIAEITDKNNNTRYIFDAQRKEKIQHAMLIIWNEDETTIPTNVLYHIMQSFPPQKSLKLNDYYQNQFNHISRKHGQQEHPLDKKQAHRFLRKIFCATA